MQPTLMGIEELPRGKFFMVIISSLIIRLSPASTERGDVIVFRTTGIERHSAPVSDPHR